MFQGVLNGILEHFFCLNNIDSYSCKIKKIVLNLWQLKILLWKPLIVIIITKLRAFAILI